MFVVTLILSLLLAAVAAGSAAGKLTRQERVVTMLDHLGVGRLIPALALLEALGALGLVLGLGIEPLGVAAAAGLALYFIGAVVFHVQAHDQTSEMAPAAVLAVVAIVVLVLRAATA